MAESKFVANLQHDILPGTVEGERALVQGLRSSLASCRVRIAQLQCDGLEVEIALRERALRQEGENPDDEKLVESLKDVFPLGDLVGSGRIVPFLEWWLIQTDAEIADRQREQWALKVMIADSELRQVGGNPNKVKMWRS